MTSETSLDKQSEIKGKLSEVISHAERMRVSADSTRRKCVDGGYKENEAVGATAIPGADLGVSLALLKMRYSPQQSFNLVYEFVAANDQLYCWHTDTHEGHGDCVVGCGHCNAAINSAEHYEVESNKVRELLEIVRRKQKEGEGMEMINLDREHAEKGILIITTLDYTVKPWDQNNDVQYFIYDKACRDKFLQDFVDFHDKRRVDIDVNVLLQACDDQTNATLGLLDSSKGKPMYTVNVSGEKPEVKYLKDAPVIE